jgi:hypothetical protein
MQPASAVLPVRSAAVLMCHAGCATFTYTPDKTPGFNYSSGLVRQLVLTDMTHSVFMHGVVTRAASSASAPQQLQHTACSRRPDVVTTCRVCQRRCPATAS